MIRHALRFRRFHVIARRVEAESIGDPVVHQWAARFRHATRAALLLHTPDERLAQTVTTDADFSALLFADTVSVYNAPLPLDDLLNPEVVEDARDRAGLIAVLVSEILTAQRVYNRELRAAFARAATADPSELVRVWAIYALNPAANPRPELPNREE